MAEIVRMATALNGRVYQLFGLSAAGRPGQREACSRAVARVPAGVQTRGAVTEIPGTKFLL